MPTRLSIPRPACFLEFPKGAIVQGIHQRVEEQARLYPAKPAVRTRGAAYSYAQVNGFANSIAAEVLSASGNELAQVAILMPNTADIIIAMLASLKAHKAYVPLDPNFPKERLQFMLEDAESAVLLTDDQHMGRAEELVGRRVRIINTSRIERHVDAPNPGVACDPL